MTRRITGTDPKYVSYLEAVKQFEESIALDCIAHFVERLIAVHEPYGIEPEILIDGLLMAVTRHGPST
jgi:hypothetical protein